jgi:hypothetical protein
MLENWAAHELVLNLFAIFCSTCLSFAKSEKESTIKLWQGPPVDEISSESCSLAGLCVSIVYHHHQLVRSHRRFWCRGQNNTRVEREDKVFGDVECLNLAQKRV